MKYDKKFRKKFRGDSVNRMRRIVNLAQAIFQHSSLTTKISLSIKETKYVNTNLHLTTDAQT